MQLLNIFFIIFSTFEPLKLGKLKFTNDIQLLNIKEQSLLIDFSPLVNII